jgi:hypothetical protein
MMRPLNVRRKGHFAVGINKEFEALAGRHNKAKSPFSAGGIIYDFGRKLAISKVDLVADADFSGGLHDGIPEVGFRVQLAHKKHFYFGSGFFLVAPQSARERQRLVINDHIVLIEKLRQVCKVVVGDFAGIFSDYEETYSVAGFGGILGNLAFGKVKVVIAEPGAHRGAKIGVLRVCIFVRCGEKS